MWGWIVIGAIVLIVLGAISSQGDKVKQATEKAAQDSTNELRKRERVAAYRDFLVRTGTSSDFAEMTDRERDVALLDAIDIVSRAQTEADNTSKGAAIIFLVLVAIGVWIGATNDGMWGPVAGGCVALLIGLGSLSDKEVKKTWAGARAEIERRGLDFNRIVEAAGIAGAKA